MENGAIPGVNGCISEKGNNFTTERIAGKSMWGQLEVNEGIDLSAESGRYKQN
jgi:hypothetical protein